MRRDAVGRKQTTEIGALHGWRRLEAVIAYGTSVALRLRSVPWTDGWTNEAVATRVTSVRLVLEQETSDLSACGVMEVPRANQAISLEPEEAADRATGSDEDRRGQAANA